MSHIDTRTEIEPACCVNAGCANRFDPFREGWNGECDPCAATAGDHAVGAHQGFLLDCLLCSAEPAAAEWSVAVAA